MNLTEQLNTALSMNEKLSKEVVNNLIAFLNKNLSFNVDDLVDLDHSKRDYLVLSDIYNSNGTDRRYNEIVSLSKGYGGKLIKIGDNGGFGITVNVLDKDKFKNSKNESLNNIDATPKKGITIKVDSDDGIETIKNAVISNNNKKWKVAKVDNRFFISKDGRIYMEVDKDNKAVTDFNESNSIDSEFVDYFNSFYGPEGIYKKANKVKRPYTLDELEKALSMRDKERKFPFEGDSVDRETLRDRMVDMKLLNPDY